MHNAELSDLINTKIGHNVRAAREAARLSVSELADFLACASSDIVAFEAGKARISAVKLHRLSKCLGVSLSGLFAGTGGNAHPSRPRASSEKDPSGELSVALRWNTTFNVLIEAMYASELAA